MLVALVFVHGNTSLHTKADQGGRRTGNSISVQPINIHAVAKRLPRDPLGILGNLKQILQFQTRKAGSGIGFHGA